MARLRKTLAAVGTAAPLLAATASPALAATNSHDGKTPAERIPARPCCGGSGHYVTWQDQNNGQYLHATSTARSAVVNTAWAAGSCANHGATNLECSEEWSQISTGYAHQYAFANDYSGKCLIDGGNKTGITAQQYSCNYTTNERWIYGSFANSNGIGVYNALYTAYGTHARTMCVSIGDANVYIYGGISNALAGDGNCDWQ
jgi:hypothetical protein